MFWPRLHRWLAILLVGPLVVWSVTGLMFHLKPGWGRAYDMLSAEKPLPVAGVASIEVVAGTVPTPIDRIELFGSALGPLYRVSTAGGAVLVDAVGARRRSPLSADDARELAADAVARSKRRDEYGTIGAAVIDGGVVHVAFTHATVDVDRASARITQHGADTERIDWLYRIHYLQWTGHEQIDRALPLVGLGLVWIVSLAGIVLFVRRFRT